MQQTCSIKFQKPTLASAIKTKKKNMMNTKDTQSPKPTFENKIWNQRWTSQKKMYFGQPNSDMLNKKWIKKSGRNKGWENSVQWENRCAKKWKKHIRNITKMQVNSKKELMRLMQGKEDLKKSVEKKRNAEEQNCKSCRKIRRGGSW